MTRPGAKALNKALLIVGLKLKPAGLDLAVSITSNPLGALLWSAVVLQRPFSRANHLGTRAFGVGVAVRPRLASSSRLCLQAPLRTTSDRGVMPRPAGQCGAPASD